MVKVRRCTSDRVNGQRCRNKALTNKAVCHKHDAAHPVKAPEKHPILFHLFFLYGLRKYGNAELLKHEVPGARGPWKQIAECTLEGRVSNAMVQAHAHRYSEWMRRNGLDDHAAVVAAIKAVQAPAHTGKYRVSSARMHLFLRFNQYTLHDYAYYRTVVLVNDVPYCLGEEGPRRVDEAYQCYGLPHNYTTLQALDGYTLDVDGTGARAHGGCTLLQQECQAATSLRAPGESLRGRPLVSMSVTSHRVLAAACVDALDHSDSPWRGACPLVVDFAHLVEAAPFTVPVVHDTSECAPYDFMDMPVLMDLELNVAELNVAELQRAGLKAESSFCELLEAPFAAERSAQGPGAGAVGLGSGGWMGAVERTGSPRGLVRSPVTVQSPTVVYRRPLFRYVARLKSVLRRR